MDLESEDENVIEEDFYSFLNIPKEVCSLISSGAEYQLCNNAEIGLT